MKRVKVSELRAAFSKYLRLAERGEVVITRHGKPAGVLIGFADDDAWFDYRLVNDPRFLRRIGAARAAIRAGKGVKDAIVAGGWGG